MDSKKVLLKLLTFYIPSKSLKKKVRKKILKGFDIIRQKRLKTHYQNILTKLKNKFKKEEKITVIFLGYSAGSTVDLFSSLYEKFVKDNKFECKVVITPYVHDTKEGMIERLEKAQEFLQQKNIPFINGYDIEKDQFLNVSQELHPDIVFFENGYDWNHPYFKIEAYPNSLNFLIPYSPMLADNLQHHFNQKIFYDAYQIFHHMRSEIPLQAKNAPIKLENIYPEYLGSTKLDVFRDKAYIAKEVWKTQQGNRKRIIWAPHHCWATYTNFILYKDIMLELAEQYKDKIQVCFKPHPALYESLVEIENWSREEVESYYNKWKNLENGQVELGDWVDLFITSDAMLMDSISFMAEYSATGKPSAVICREDENQHREMDFNELGEEILGYLYTVKNEEEIIQFIEGVVIDGNDTKKNERNAYILNQITPDNKQLASSNIYRYINDLLM